MKRVYLKGFVNLSFVAASVLAGTSALAESERGRGLIFMEPEAYEALPVAKPLKTRAELPAKVDLSAYFPKPGDQGTQGSCAGWASAYMMSYYQGRKNKWNLNTPEHIFSPSFIYNQVKGKGDCNQGSILYENLKLMTTVGSVPISMFPYVHDDCARQPSAEVSQAAANYKIPGFQRINIKNVLEAKKFLAEEKPIAVGMAIDYPFITLDKNYIYSLYAKGVRGYLYADKGHAMVVVGYDDSKKAFRVINSWNTSWGDDGYGWIDYDSFSKRMREGYVITG